MIFNPRFKIYIIGYNTFMKNVKNLKFIIIAIVVFNAIMGIIQEAKAENRI